MITGSILSPSLAIPGVPGVEVPVTTRIISLTNVSISPHRDFMVFSSEDWGFLCELLVRAASPYFGIRLYIDDTISIDNSYVDLTCIGQSSPDISAFDELDMDGNRTGFYIVSIRNIPYYESCSAFIDNNSGNTLILPHIFVKYIVRIT